MRVLGLDFETTGLDVKNDRVVEIGAALFDIGRPSPLKVLSQFVYAATYPKLSSEIVALTGIRQEDLDAFGLVPGEVFPTLVEMINQADAVVAHNGKKFDFLMLASELKRLELTHKPDILFIDTSVDLPYPSTITTRKLTHLAAEHGFLNPFAHRALFDVLTMHEILRKYSWDEVLSLAHQKDVTVRAVVKFEERDLAKARGYRWDGERKFWLKLIKENQVSTETQEAPFKIQVLEF